MEIGLIGLGQKAHIHLDTTASIDGVEVIAGADVARPARDQFESEFTGDVYERYEAMLDEQTFDAVLISTPHTLHYEHAMACVERGNSVFIEKPMVTNVADAVRLVDAVDERGEVLQVGYQRHFDPAYREVKRVLDDGQLGEINLVSGHLAHGWLESKDEGSWRLNPELAGGGQLYDSGSHLLDLLLWLTDATPESVAATMDYGGTDVDVNTALAISLDRGGESVTASLSVGGNTTGLVIDTTIHGTDGYLQYDNGDTIAVSASGRESDSIHVGDLDRSVNDNMLRSFFECVKNGDEPEVSAEHGLWITALTEAARIAADRDETVEVPTLIERARREADNR